MKYDHAVIGGGIVGLATAMTILERAPGSRVVVLEKETDLALHQTGRNSGVIHSGIYYKPGSLKARFARAGSRSMVAFCQEHGIAHEICGKIIVATDPEELPRLATLQERALANGVEARRLGPEELREHEPNVSGIAGLHIPAAGIVSYRAVAAEYARIIRERDGEIRLGCEVTGMQRRGDAVTVETSSGDVQAEMAVNCGGLHSDRIAAMAGAAPGARIVPFRGEYYELAPEARGLVRNLIYPVPNPAFPFLGVHFTRMIDGSVHAGPNAVLALRREGYTKTAVSLRDAVDSLTYPGFWRLASRHFADGLHEVVRSFSKRAFLRSLQRLIPAVQDRDLVPSQAGVRAQALRADGSLVDDFLFVRAERTLHVCNAPSPGATASLEIGRAVADQLFQSRILENV